MKKRQNSAGGAWAMLLVLLVWWHTSPVEALEGWATNGLSETSAPILISQLNRAAATAPQIYIISPRSEEVIADTTVAVQLQVSGTPIFKNSQLGLGPHLHLLLDRVPTESIYSLNTPITLSNLSPGTHTLQVLANKPWHESWKNPQAFAQVTFHILAKSIDSPNVQTPQLISVQPTAVGAEPWLLDFYVANAPSHVDAQHPLRQIADWRVRVTVNEQSFEVNRDEPIYLRGLRPGVNVLKLEYLNAQGQVADSAVRVVRYQPNGNDGLSRLVRNELSIDQALTLFDPQSQFSVAQPTGNELEQGNRSITALPFTQQPAWNQIVPSKQDNLGMQGNPVIQNNPGMQTSPVMQGNSEARGNPGAQSNPPGMYGNSGMQSNPPGMYGNSGMQSNPPGMYGNSGMQSNPPGMYGNSGMQSNPPGMYGNSGTQNNPPGMYGNSGMQSNPPGMYGNSGTQNNPPGMYGNSGMQSNPPGMYGNSGTQNNPPGMYGNSGMQSNPPGMYGNSGMQWNPEMPRNSINPVSPQSILLAPSRTLSNAAEISQLKLPQTIAKEPSAAIAFLPPINQEQKEIAANSQNLPPKASSKDIALLPPVQPQPTSPNLRTTEPKEPIAELAPKPIDPLVTKQPEKITIDPSQSTTKFPTIPSPSNDTIAKVDPQSLPLTASDKAVDFKVIGQELLHTTSIKIKQFTNQIPPLVSSWSENFRHWLSDRMAAMRANPSPTTSTRETTSYQK
jgi:hypothetical protein